MSGSMSAARIQWKYSMYRLDCYRNNHHRLWWKEAKKSIRRSASRVARQAWRREMRKMVDGD